MFAVVDKHKPGCFNQGRMFHCGRAIYRAHLIIAPGMGAVMRRGAARAFSRGRRRPAGSPTHRGGAGGAEMPVQPEANLSGQPGSRLVSALRCERMRSNAACMNECGKAPK